MGALPADLPKTSRRAIRYGRLSNLDHAQPRPRALGCPSVAACEGPWRAAGSDGADNRSLSTRRQGSVQSLVVLLQAERYQHLAIERSRSLAVLRRMRGRIHASSSTAETIYYSTFRQTESGRRLHPTWCTGLTMGLPPSGRWTGTGQKGASRLASCSICGRNHISARH